MTTLNANFRAMRQAADDTLTCHKALAREKEGLDQFLGTLRGTWGGGASANWQGAQKEWNDACDEVNGILHHLYSALEVALANYTHTEHYLEQAWGG
jgi:WXG100 family type VII secretion target